MGSEWGHYDCVLLPWCHLSISLLYLMPHFFFFTHSYTFTLGPQCWVGSEWGHYDCVLQPWCHLSIPTLSKCHILSSLPLLWIHYGSTIMLSGVRVGSLWLCTTAIWCHLSIPLCPMPHFVLYPLLWVHSGYTMLSGVRVGSLRLCTTAMMPSIHIPTLSNATLFLLYPLLWAVRHRKEITRKSCIDRIWQNFVQCPDIFFVE